MNLSRNNSIRSRRGFTLVELMVAAALAITIMWILAESFKMGIDFARSARSTGDLMTQLNNAGQIMNNDLQNVHFQVLHPNLYNGVNGKLSSVRLDLVGSPASSPTIVNGVLATAPYTPPNGYFQIYSPPSSFIPDNSEGFSIDTATNHSLQFTVYVPTGLPQNLFTANVGGTLITSRAAEVAYFLVPQTGGGGPTQTLAVPGTVPQPAQPLFGLYRRQRLVAVTQDDLTGPGGLQTAVTADFNAKGAFGSVEVISQTPSSIPNTAPTANTLKTFAGMNGNVARMFPYAQAQNAQMGTYISGQPQFAPLSSNFGRFGDDLLLSNVLSFEVLPIWSPGGFVTQVSGFSPRPFTNITTKAMLNTNFPFDFFQQTPMPGGSQVNSTLTNTFDTWFQINCPYPVVTPNPNLNWNYNNFFPLNTPGAAQNPNLIPMPVRVTALQITIRIFDTKTQQTRQSTWRVAM